jgi:dTDP-3-amino-3,4,6-trideoxy-alpha-D-glucose transaminase
MPSIPLVNLQRQYQKLAPDIDRAMREVCARGDFILGRAVAEFETAFATYVGVRHCIGVGNGTDALHLIVRALGIGPGDEVIVPANTFIATAIAVWSAGATPVLVDCDERTATIDPAAAEAATTSRTKAIIPVHLYGQPADLDPLMAYSVRRGVPLIEDAAQAHGAAYRGRRCGGIGRAAGFSFYPGKNLGAYGDGGAITTNDDDLAEAIRLLRNCGSTVKYVHPRMGFNSRLDTMQAAVLGVKLPHLDQWNERRQKLADRYRSALSVRSDMLRVLDVPAYTTRHAWHLFVVRSLDGRRDHLVKRLQARGIGAGIHYPIAIHQQEGYRRLWPNRLSLPVTEKLAAEVFSLPLCPDLTNDEADTVIAELIGVLDEKTESRAIQHT